MRILAIDPGNTESGYALIDGSNCQPLDVGKILNEQLLDRLFEWLDGGEGIIDHISIEMIKSYGMPVGAEVFETCVWIGRFAQVVDSFGAFGMPCDLVYRADVKLHHCHSSKAKDSNITQALVDRFASGVPNHGKGSKANPGWFYGFKADIWAAYALAVYTADTLAADVRSGSYARGGGVMSDRAHPKCHTKAGHVCQKPSGRTCWTSGCDEPAGTLWGPFWCPEHDQERLDRISANLTAICATLEPSS